MPNSGLCTIHATVSVNKCIIDPITTANMTAAKLIMLARNQPMSGMNLKRAIIGEKSKKVPQQNKIHDPKRNIVDSIAFDLLRS